MTSLEHLSTIAEIAVALAGFSALVALLGVRSGRANPRLDAWRLQAMLEGSLFVVAFALLPLVVFELGASDEAGWRLSAGLFLAVALPLTVFTLVRARAFRDYFSPADRTASVVVQAFGYAADAAALLVVLGAGPELRSGLYLAALYLNLLVSVAFFIRFAASTFVPDK